MAWIMIVLYYDAMMAMAMKIFYGEIVVFGGSGVVMMLVKCHELPKTMRFIVMITAANQINSPIEYKDAPIAAHFFRFVYHYGPLAIELYIYISLYTISIALLISSSSSSHIFFIQLYFIWIYFIFYTIEQTQKFIFYFYFSHINREKFRGKER